MIGTAFEADERDQNAGKRARLIPTLLIRPGGAPIGGKGMGPLIAIAHPLSVWCCRTRASTGSGYAIMFTRGLVTT